MVGMLGGRRVTLHLESESRDGQIPVLAFPFLFGPGQMQPNSGIVFYPIFH